MDGDAQFSYLGFLSFCDLSLTKNPKKTLKKNIKTQKNHVLTLFFKNILLVFLNYILIPLIFLGQFFPCQMAASKSESEMSFLPLNQTNN